MIGLQESLQLEPPTRPLVVVAVELFPLVPTSHDVGQAVVPTLSQTELVVRLLKYRIQMLDMCVSAPDALLQSVQSR